MKIRSIILWMWENNTRWYTAEISTDLLGDLLLIQRWGGLTNTINGEKITILSDVKNGIQYLHKIDKKRKSRKNPYKLIKIKYY